MNGGYAVVRAGHPAKFVHETKFPRVAMGVNTAHELVIEFDGRLTYVINYQNDVNAQDNKPTAGILTAQIEWSIDDSKQGMGAKTRRVSSSVYALAA